MTEEQIAAVKLAIDYILICHEHNAIINSKQDAVKKQDFEEAGKWRAIETEHIKIVPTYDQFKTVREKLNQ